MGIFSDSTAKGARALQKQQGLLSAMEIETVSAERARTNAAEQARANVFGNLGLEGSYGIPGTPGAPAAPGGGANDDIYSTDMTKDPTASALAKKNSQLGNFEKADTRSGILDPKKYATSVGQSAMFRIQSQRTAEAEQLLNREGKMWNELSNSVYGVINEGSAMGLREDQRAIKNNAAKGGTARRVAMAEAQQMHAQEVANQQRTSQTWNANLALFDVVRKNADAVMQGNYNFMDNLPQVRAAYSQTMTKLAEMMTNVALPMSSNMLAAGFQAVADHPKTSTLSRILNGVIGAAQGYASGDGSNLGGGILGGLSAAMQNAPSTERDSRGRAIGATGGSGGVFGAASDTGQSAGNVYTGLKSMGSDAIDWWKGTGSADRGMTTEQKSDFNTRYGNA